MLNEQEKIDKYLDGEMSPSENREFEKEMSDNQDLAQSVALNKDLLNFFKERNPGLEETLSNLGNDYFSEEAEPVNVPEAISDTTPQSNFSWLMPILLLLVIAGGGFWYLNGPAEDVISTPSINTPSITPAETERMINNGMLEEGGVDEKSSETPNVEEESVEEMKPVMPKYDPEVDVEKSGAQPIAKVDKRTFNQNAVLESLIRENVRSSDTQTIIKLPSIGKTYFLKNKDIHLKIAGTINDNSSIELIIYDNKSASFDKDYPALRTNLVTKKVTDSDYKISFNANVSLNEGLYYYIIKKKTTGEILHISKFFVKS